MIRFLAVVTGVAPFSGISQNEPSTIASGTLSMEALPKESVTPWTRLTNMQ